jgi:methylase of polypeptide subunit release factors
MRDSNAEPPRSMQRALAVLLRWLQAHDYRFTTVTPQTHAVVLARRPDAIAQNLRDVFGWSLPFEETLIDADILHELQAADLIEMRGERLKSRVRVSSLRDHLFAHSAHPTDSNDAVFFGPDSHRFIEFVAADLQRDPVRGALLDIGGGSGVGAILTAGLMRPDRVVVTDINPTALVFARANAEQAGVDIECLQADDVRGLPGDFDLIIANPPFIEDADRLAYRHGGGQLGAQAALDWTRQALDKLARGGRFLLYSGSAIVGGHDGLKAGLEALVARGPFTLAYRELDPDIFGEQLSEAAYAKVERIAAVGVRIDRL